MKRMKEYLEHYRPDVVITRDPVTKCSRRIERLLPRICEEAGKQGLQKHSNTQETR